MAHPYKRLGTEAFWRTAVTERGAFGLEGLWSPKFPVGPDDRIVTAGSCFAQHFSKALVARGYGWYDAEPAPPFLTDVQAREFNYGIFSFRTGNIYTARMLNQWIDLALGAAGHAEIWEQDGRFFDPLRPAIEPGGFADEDELRSARMVTATALRSAIEKASVFVFTMGLTESWINRRSRMEYALCPGTAAGKFDEKTHVFVNARHSKVMTGMTRALKRLRQINPKLKVLLTVSPVPLAATASGGHVLTATSYSKSVLRAAAGELAEAHDNVDYFPSYEIITHPVFRGMFFAPDQRSVEPEGVKTVMQHFFTEQSKAFGAEVTPRAPPEQSEAEDGLSHDDLKCEEVMLDAFA